MFVELSSVILVILSVITHHRHHLSMKNCYEMHMFPLNQKFLKALHDRRSLCNPVMYLMFLGNGNHNQSLGLPGAELGED